MDFQEAAKAHRDWNTKLRMYLNGSGVLNPEDIQKDNLCALGQWIYGEGKKNIIYTEYEELRKIHMEFHENAAEIVRLIDSNKKEEANLKLSADSKFRELSLKILTLLSFMEKKAAA
ncbi:MAG: CZB domain-containing protein [Alphaproteobacteria bacterium]|nr:CZB domain-containing protein [Alphaproteobacteria bacterium]